MYRIVGSILMVLAIVAGYAIANAGTNEDPATAVPAPAGAEPAKNFNL